MNWKFEMTTTNVNTSAPFGAITVYRLVIAAETVIAAFVSWRANRRTRIALASLSDDVLADIGLSPRNLGRDAF